MLIESPDQYISHVVKQSGGVPQAIYDMLDESSKERLIDKRKVREMRHDAGVQYLDFTPMIMVLGALIVSMRYIGIDIGSACPTIGRYWVGEQAASIEVYAIAPTGRTPRQCC